MACKIFHSKGLTPEVRARRPPVRQPGGWRSQGRSGGEAVLDQKGSAVERARSLLNGKWRIAEEGRDRQRQARVRRQRLWPCWRSIRRRGE